MIYTRLILPQIQKQLNRGKSILLLGPRQTGKTTLLKSLNFELSFDLLNITNKLKYEKNPQLLIDEIEDFLENKYTKKKIPLIYIDEIQKVPALLDPIQSLIDNKKAQFILTGSSARKLRTQAQTNLLPGRVVLFQMYGFALGEVKSQKLEDFLMFGCLPSIYLNSNVEDKELDLKSYVEIYLEQEIRQEAVTRNLGAFSRFLELAGIEAGQILNYSKIAQDIGVSVNTLKSYFEILFDTLIAERVTPIISSETRKKLIKTERFLFFDLGVRRHCANEGFKPTPDRLGQIFEQFIGIELIKQFTLYKSQYKLKFWKDPDGPEVDWVIDTQDEWIPIEVKLSRTVNTRDTQNLGIFLNEYPKKAKRAFLILNCDKSFKISDTIRAVPWKYIEKLKFLKE